MVRPVIRKIAKTTPPPMVLNEDDDENELISCDICDKTFKTEQTKANHVRKLHAHTTEYCLCPVCKNCSEEKPSIPEEN